MEGFLDDILYNYTVNKSIVGTNDFKDLINELFKLCEERWKPQVDSNTTKKELKILLDRTFISWDCFVRKLEKEKWYLYEFIKEYSYKNIFMSNEKMKSIYDSL